MKKRIFIIIIFIFIFLLIFGIMYIYSNNKNQDSADKLKEKADVEIDYLSETIIAMMSELNNVQITDEQNSITNMNQNDISTLTNLDKKTDWNALKKDVENMYQTWNTVIIDLNGLGLKQENLLKFTTYLGNITNDMQNKNKKSAMYNLADLYSLIDEYTKEYSNDNKRIILTNVKSDILYSYALIEDQNWKEMKKYIQKSQTTYSELMNSTMQSELNPINVNKAYILINELSKSIDSKNKDVFYINYKNLMNELDKDKCVGEYIVEIENIRSKDGKCS